MQIVIDIPKECVTLDTCFIDWVKAAGDKFEMTILPKGHGRLIDADAYKKNVFKKFPCNSSDDRNMRRLTELALKDAQTIVEADGGIDVTIEEDKEGE